MDFISKLRQWIGNKLLVIFNTYSKKFRKFYRHQHQLTSVTGNDRYPQLFLETTNLIGRENPIAILSFGCSTGEECFSLKSYFPNSKIVGVDINRLSVKQATKKNRFSDIEFFVSSPELIKKKGPYDIIFCLSVLCRWEDTLGLKNCENVYPFTKYNATVEMLTQQVKTGGLLVIYNSNFRFEETIAFENFEIVETPSIENSGFVTKFGKDNNVIHDVHHPCIYKKR